MLKIKVISKVQSATGITKAISDVVTFILGAINSISSITNFVVVGGLPLLLTKLHMSVRLLLYLWSYRHWRSYPMLARLHASVRLHALSKLYMSMKLHESVRLHASVKLHVSMNGEVAYVGEAICVGEACVDEAAAWLWSNTQHDPPLSFTPSSLSFRLR